MSEPRVYVDMELQAGTVVTMPHAAFHHLVAVLRRIPGDPLTLFNGQGGEYACKVESVARHKLSVRVEEFRDVSRESPLPVLLAQAVSKGEKMDYAIQKAVELGVTTVQPLLAERVVVKLDAERWARKIEHWQAIAISACEQSGRTRIPKVAPALDMRDWLPTCPHDTTRLVLSPGAAAGTVLTPGKGGVVLLVGPEGGFSEMELKLADLAGFVGVTLGPRVLRTETAGLVAVSVIQSLWGDLGSTLNKGN